MSNYVDHKEIWAANDVERIVKRNAKWLEEFIIAGVRAMMRDNRPIFTQKISPAQQMEALLNAPPQFWTALQASDPAQAAELVAKVLKARSAGQIPNEGPLANQVGPQDATEQDQLATAIPPQGPPNAFGTASGYSDSTAGGQTSYT